jgi:uncharacterized protein YdeI (YjbR/CyaY-like superfamily)
VSGAAPAAVEAWYGALTRWQDAAAADRALLGQTALLEAWKWRAPCYTAHGGNILIVHDFAAGLGLGFFKGALLDDPGRLLAPPGPNSRASRVVHFKTPEEVTARAPALKELIGQAIDVEAAGQQVDFPKDDLPVPEELLRALEVDGTFAAAWSALTPGRRRGWLLHFNGGKQSATRRRRVDKARDRVLRGRGVQGR